MASLGTGCDEVGKGLGFNPAVSSFKNGSDSFDESPEGMTRFNSCFRMSAQLGLVRRPIFQVFRLLIGVAGNVLVR